MTDDSKTTTPENETSVATQNDPPLSDIDPADAHKELFARHEIDEFSRDDSQAGVAIGKMLALFFLYTVIAMTIVSGCTYSLMTD